MSARRIFLSPAESRGLANGRVSLLRSSDTAFAWALTMQALEGRA